MSEHARPYSDSIYDEMVAEQESRRKADQRAEEEIQRQREIQEEAHRNTMQEEVARLILIICYFSTNSCTKVSNYSS